MGVKIDLKNFEYNSKYNLPDEHRWDFMEKSENEKEYFDEKTELCKPKRGIVASSPEVVGQIGSMIDSLDTIDFETNIKD